MLLVVDVGNTQTVLGFYEDDDLIHDFRIGSDKERTLDEYHVLLRSLLDVAEITRDEVEAAIPDGRVFDDDPPLGDWEVRVVR